MRDVTLEIIVAALALVALVQPRIGLYAYLWYALMRPDVLAWSPAGTSYSLLLAAGTLLGSLRYLGRMWLLLTNPLSRWLILLQIPVIASAFFAVDSDLAWDPLKLYLRIIAMALLIPVLIETPAQLKTLIVVMAVSVGVLGMKFGLYGLYAGGVRYNVGYGGFMSDNNTLALALAMGVALCWGARSLVSSAWVRWMFLVMVMTGTTGVVMTYSRGSALALATAFGVIAYRSQRRMLAVLALLAMAVPPILLVGTSYADRLATLNAPKDDSSARSRLENYSAAIRMWKDYPLLGVGFGQENERALFSRYTDRASGEADLVVHDTYLQILVDSGAPAFLIYTGLLAGTICWLGSGKQRLRSAALSLSPAVEAIQLALIAFAVGALFLSREQFDLAYMLLMSAAAWWRIQDSSTKLGMIVDSEPEMVEVAA